jgi:hypothetical protein
MDDNAEDDAATQATGDDTDNNLPAADINAVTKTMR